MLLTCPSCGGRASIEAWENDGAQREFMVLLARAPRPVAEQLLRYFGLFRAPGANRAMSWKKALRISKEVMALVVTGYVQGKGKVARPCSVQQWGQGMETMVDMASAGQLSLPMKSHNYLISIVWQSADKADKANESSYREQEATGHVRTQQPASPQYAEDGPNKYELAYEEERGPGALDNLTCPENLEKIKAAFGTVAASTSIKELLSETKEQRRNAKRPYTSTELNDFIMSMEMQYRVAFIDATQEQQNRIMLLPPEQRLAEVKML